MTKKAEARDDIWNGDLLQRRAEAEFLQNFLNTLSEDNIRSRDQGSLVINLKGPWGFGKSYFLSRFARQLRASGHKVAELNAWKADPTIDPLVSLMAALENEIRPELKNSKSQITKAFDAAKSVGGLIAKNAGTAFTMSLMKRVFGSYAEELQGKMEDALNYASIKNSEALSGAVIDATETTIESMDKLDLDIQHSSYFSKSLKAAGKQEEAIKYFSESIGKIAAAYKKKSGGKAPFYVIVDELDRCRPTFSIEVLERINHLFDIEGLIFVIGTHSDELVHSISAVYGSSFNSSGYLNRFFDYTYNLATPEISAWIKYLLDEFSLDLSRYKVPEGNDPAELIKSISIAAGLSFRDYRQVFFLIKAVESVIEKNILLDLISLYSHAISVHIKEEDYLLNNTSDKNYRLPSCLDSVFISYSSEGKRGKLPVTKYLRDMLNKSRLPLTDSQQKASPYSTHTIDTHCAELVLNQIHTIRRSISTHERPSWGRYIDLLRTAQRFSLVD